MWRTVFVHSCSTDEPWGLGVWTLGGREGEGGGGTGMKLVVLGVVRMLLAGDAGRASIAIWSSPSPSTLKDGKGQVAQTCGTAEAWAIGVVNGLLFYIVSCTLDA